MIMRRRQLPSPGAYLGMTATTVRSAAVGLYDRARAWGRKSPIGSRATSSFRGAAAGVG